MPLPKYERIAASIRASIDDGTFSAGDRLPGTRTIAEQYKVTRSTAAKALTTLADAGVIVARRTAQYVVADAVAQRPATAAPAGAPSLRLTLAQALLKNCTPFYDVAASPRTLWKQMHAKTREEWLIRADLVLDQLAADGIDMRQRDDGIGGL